MKKTTEFKLFLESMTQINPAVIAGIMQASEAIFEGWGHEEKTFPTSQNDQRLRSHWINHLTRYLINLDLTSIDSDDIETNIAPIAETLEEYDNGEDAFASILADVKKSIERMGKENPNMKLNSAHGGLMSFIDALVNEYT